MTFKEFGQLADAIKTYFPRDNMLPTPAAMELWYDMLKDIDYQTAYIGLKNHVATSKFAPTIADIRNGAAIKQPQELNEMEAWVLVSKAIRNSTYNSVEEYVKLPPVVQKAVGLPDQLRTWAMDEHYSEGVIMSQFQKCYQAELKRQEEFQKLPSDVQRLIQNTTVSSPKAQIDTKRDLTIKTLCENENALETKIEGIPIPEAVKEKMEVLREECRS